MHRRLLIRPGAIGDVVLSLPALECLLSGYTEIWAPRAVVPLLGFASRAEPIASTGIDSFGLPGVAPSCGVVERLRSFDSIISWYGTNRDDFRGALNSCGGACVRFFPALPPRGGNCHAADFFLAQAAEVHPCHQRSVPRLRGLASSESGHIAIHPFSGSPRKNWPLDRFEALAEAFADRKVRLCAEPGSGLKGAVEVENLWDLAGWLSGASLYVGNDSGITHLAAAAGVPVLVLFGPTSPDVWAPRGERVRVVEAPGGDLTRLSVSEIYEIARGML